MVITYFLGNGFDINYGLATRYSDFYPYLLKNASANNYIKGKIQEDISKWSDYEYQLGQAVDEINENTKESFYKDKEEVDLLLSNYLLEQQKTILNENIANETDEFARSLEEFGKLLSEEEQERYIGRINQTELIYYKIVSFNYTNLIDRLIDASKKKKTAIKHLHLGNVKTDSIYDVIHLHGTLQRELITGVNDKSQINNATLLEDSTFLDYLIKPRMNEGVGNNNIRKVSSIIDESGFIILFGVSIGDTDTMWWKKIIEWLMKNESHVLYICQYAENIENIEKLPAAKLREENNVRNILLRKQPTLTGIQKEKLRKQIVILFNPEIFRFRK